MIWLIYVIKCTIPTLGRAVQKWSINGLPMKNISSGDTGKARKAGLSNAASVRTLHFQNHCQRHWKYKEGKKIRLGEFFSRAYSPVQQSNILFSCSFRRLHFGLNFNLSTAHFATTLKSSIFAPGVSSEWNLIAASAIFYDMTFGAFPCSRAAPWQPTLSLASMQLPAYGVSVYPVLIVGL